MNRMMCLQDRSAQPAFDKITGYIQKAKDAGGEVLIGGSGDDSKGYFIQPMIFTETKPDMRTVREEIFGPVGVVISILQRQSQNSIGNWQD